MITVRRVLVVLLVLAMVAAGCGGDDDDTAEDATITATVEEVEVLTTTVPPAAVVVVSGHSSLTDGLVVHNGGSGQYAFWVPSGDEYLSLWVSIEDADVSDTDGSEARFFGVADRFVQELGWLG